MINTPITGAALWGALSAIAGFLTDKVGVPVVRGGRPSTDLKSIFLPKLPDTSMTWSEVIKVIAFLYHEAAHILWTTHGDEVMTPLERSIRGKLEDIRIELKAIGTFPAAAKYLGDLVRMLVEEGMSESPKGVHFPPLNDDQTEVQVLQWYLLYRLRHDVLHQKGMAPLMPGVEAVVTKKLPSGMRTRLDALMFQITECWSPRNRRRRRKRLSSGRRKSSNSKTLSRRRTIRNPDRTTATPMPPVTGIPTGSSKPQEPPTAMPTGTGLTMPMLRMPLGKASQDPLTGTPATMGQATPPRTAGKMQQPTPTRFPGCSKWATKTLWAISAKC